MRPRLFIVDDEAPARDRLKMLLSDIVDECPHEVVGEAGDARAALEAIGAARPDIVLLDVQMPGMTGIDMAAQLMQRQPSAPAVIFVTAHDEYALKAFEVQALDYLLKPVRAARLAEAIRRVWAMRTPQPELQDPHASRPVRLHFCVQERGRLLLVPVVDVIYCKAELKYVTLRTRTQEYLLEESLASIEVEMPEVFIRVHRNALVARTAIVGVERAAHSTDVDSEGDRTHEPWQVILRDIDERLPISRRQWPAVKALVR